MSVEERLVEALQESNRWLRVLALPALRESLAAEMDRPELRRIYQESDGRPIRDVAKAAGVGHATVQRHWQNWAAKALLEPTEVAGRYRKIIDLREVGLEA